MDIKKFTTIFFLICFAVVVYGFYKVFLPFLVPILWALILTTVFYPLHKRLTVKLKGRAALSSVLMLVLISVLIILPVISVVVMLANQSIEVYDVIEQELKSGWDPVSLIKNSEWLSGISERISKWVDLRQMDWKGALLRGLNGLSSFLVDQSSNILGQFAGFIINFLIMLVTMYYLFKDGSEIYAAVKELSPLPDEYEDMLVNQFRDVSYATLYGSIMTALCQGLAGGILFWVLGLSGALLWGAVMAFLSFIPVVGAFLVWMPAGGYLMLTGHPVKGIVMWVLGAVVVSSIDNVLKPIFIKGKADMHTLLVFFSVFGGMKVFGFLGLVVGPLVVALFLTFLNLYKMEFKDLLTQKILRDQSKSLLLE